VAGGRVWRGAVVQLTIRGDYWIGIGRSDRVLLLHTD
jgi:hypothetical protein